jgi:hypothetical protein
MINGESIKRLPPFFVPDEQNQEGVITLSNPAATLLR